MQIKYIKKNDGRIVPFEISKIQEQINFAVDGSGISPIAFESLLNLSNRETITSAEIQDTIINTGAQQISIDGKEWDTVVGRADMWRLYRQIYKRTKHEVQDWQEFIKYLVRNDYYRKDILTFLEKLDDSQISKINKVIDKGNKNNFDFKMTYAQVEILKSKYLIKNKRGVIEYPIIADIANALILSRGDKHFNKIFEMIHNQLLSLATPFKRNLRRPNGNVGSCFIGENIDSLSGLMKAFTDMGFISKEGGGIGWYLGKVRPEDTYSYKIVKSNNITKWAKIVNDIAVAVNQGGCVERNTIVEVLDEIEIDGKTYNVDKGYIYFKGDKYSINEIEKVTCKHCGFQSENISSHIRHKHNENKSEYGSNVSSVVYRVNKSKSTVSPFSKENYENEEEYNKFLKNKKKGNGYEVDLYLEKGFSLDEAEKKVLENKEKSSNTLEKYINKYGENEGEKKWNDRNKNIGYKSSKDYLKNIKKLTDNEIRDLKDNNSLSSFVKRLGKEKGIEEYKKYMGERHITHFNKKYWIDKGYTEEESKEKVRNIQSRNIDWWINKYGNDLGLELREQWIIDTRNDTTNGGVSKESKEFIIKMNEFFNNKLDIESEVRVGAKSIDFKVSYNDKSVYIEYYGEFWHASHLIFESDDIVFGGKTAKEIWEKDENRIKVLEKQIGQKIYICWSNENFEDFFEIIKKDMKW